MLSIEQAPDGTLHIAGRLDAAQAPLAQARLDSVAGSALLDCRALDYISSAGLGVLLKTHKRLSVAGGRLRLTGLSPHIRDIFVYSGFDQVFEIEPAA